MSPTLIDNSFDEDDERKAEENAWPDENVRFEEPPFIPVQYTPEPLEESVRQSGLAWSAGIAFFGSVAFTLFLGWIADQLLGSSPWGIVGGIVLGSLIGFVQFFRITSQIFPSKKSDNEIRPLLSRKDDDEL
jgi:F0F1-type ATP synthase assembly protein I